MGIRNIFKLKKSHSKSAGRSRPEGNEPIPSVNTTPPYLQWPLTMSPWAMVFLLIQTVSAVTTPQNIIDVNTPVPVPVYNKSSDYFVIGGLFSITSGGIVAQKGIHRAEAFKCAVDRFNQDPNMLPGKTVYYNLADDADNAIHSVYKSMNFINSSIMAVVGASASANTDADSKVLSSFDIPLISYASSSSALADISRYPTLLRTVADDSYQTKAMVSLAQNLDWTLIAAVGTDDTYGANGLASFIADAQEANLQIPCAQTVPTGQVAAVASFASCLKRSAAKVVMVFANEHNAANIITGIQTAGALANDMVFIASDSWATSLPPTLLKQAGVDPSVLAGTIATIQWPGDLSVFQNCLANLRPETNDYAQFTEYWQNRFHCSLDPQFVGSTCPEGYDPSRIACKCNNQDSLAGDRADNKVAFVDDAVHAVLNALHHLIYQCEDLPESLQDTCSKPTLTSQNILDAVRALSFQGLSGDISFDGVNRGSNAYDYLQYDGTKWNKIGDWKSSNNITSVSINSGKLTWRPGQKLAPISIIVTDLVRAASPIGVVVKVLAALGLLGNAFLCYYIMRHRHHEVIKRSSPLFCLLMLFGMALIYVDLFLWDGPQNVALCVSKIWIPLIGFATIMGPLLAKTWRVYKIFSNSRLRTRMLLNSHLLAMYGVVLAGELLLLVIWTGYDTLIPTKIQSAASSLYVFEACRGKHERFQGGMFIAFIIYNALLLGAGSIMSYKTRKVHSSFNESKYIAYAIYNISLCMVVLLPIYMTIGDVPGSALRSYIVRSLAMLFGNTSAMLILFGTKAYQLYRNVTADDYDSSGGGPNSGKLGSGALANRRPSAQNVLGGGLGGVYTGGPGGPRRVSGSLDTGRRGSSELLKEQEEKKAKENSEKKQNLRVMKAVKTTIDEGEEDAAV